MKCVYILLLAVQLVNSVKFKKKTEKKKIPDFWDQVSRKALESKELQVESELGKGGFGVVYKVKPNKGKAQAAKSIYSGKSTDTDYLPAREVQAMLKLKNVPLTLQMCDFFPIAARSSIESGLIITSELAKTDLKKQLEHVFGTHPQKQPRAGVISRICHKFSLCPKNSGIWLSPQEIEAQFRVNKFYFLAQMAVGLHNIHSKGLIHRDIKPDNYMLINNKLLVLGDFGLTIAENTPKEEIRFAGTRGFTPNDYEEGHYVTSQKGDIYALGILFEMVENKTFFKCFYNFECPDSSFYEKIRINPKESGYVDHVELIKKLRKQSHLPSSTGDSKLKDLIFNKMLVNKEERLDSAGLIKELAKLSLSSVRRAESINSSDNCGSHASYEEIFGILNERGIPSMDPEALKYYKRIRESVN